MLNGHQFKTKPSTVLLIIKLTYFPVIFQFRLGPKSFAIFEKVVHSLGPSDKPSYPASHKASSYLQRS